MMTLLTPHAPPPQSDTRVDSLPSAAMQHQYPATPSHPMYAMATPYPPQQEGPFNPATGYAGSQVIVGVGEPFGHPSENHQTRRSRGLGQKARRR